MPTRFWIAVKPNARRDIVEPLHLEYRVSVHAPAEKGRANQALIDVLAEYFSVPKSRIKILRGSTSRRKLIEIA